MQTTGGTALTAPREGRGLDRRLIWLLVAAAGVTLDQITKQLAVTHLDPQRPVPLLGGLLRLQLTWNDGAAFSLGGGGRFTAVFTCFAALVFLGVTWYVFARLRHRGWALVLGLLTAGQTGNLIDRLTRPPAFGVGHVVDFLQLPYWPIFNVADMCVTAAAIGIVWLAVVKNVPPGEIKPENATETAETTESAETSEAAETSEPPAATESVGTDERGEPAEQAGESTATVDGEGRR